MPVALAVTAQTLLAVVAIAGLLAYLVSRGDLRHWPAVATVLLLATLNSTKWPESDLAEYLVYLDQAARVDVISLLADDDVFVSIKPTEPVFRLWAWFVANLLPMSRPAFSLLSSIVIYGAVLWLARRAVGSGSQSSRGAAVLSTAAFAALTIGITFSLTAHLTRQYLAGAIFAVGFCEFLVRGRWRWLMLTIVACGVHNSAVLLLLPLALSLLLWRRPVLLLAAYGLLLALSLTGRIPWISDLIEDLSWLKEDGQISVALISLDLMLWATAAWLWHRGPRVSDLGPGAATRIAWLALGVAVILICVRDVPLLFFRAYFYVELLRAPLIAYVASIALSRAGTRALTVSLLIITGAITIFALRLASAEWSYSSSRYPWPDALLIHSLAERWLSIERASF